MLLKFKISATLIWAQKTIEIKGKMNEMNKEKIDKENCLKILIEIVCKKF